MMMKLIGPFKQILTLSGLPVKGALSDEMLHIIADGGVVVEGDKILETGNFDVMARCYPHAVIDQILHPMVLLPGFVDCHTHLCFAGSRSRDYALRIAGKTYLEIAASGGGIWDSVTQTRQATAGELADMLCSRASRHFGEGITTIEVKSGYGLSLEAEVKQLSAIKTAAKKTRSNLIPTCLAAHMKPHDFEGSASAYLDYVLHDILPVVRQENLASRIDVFIEQSAFGPEQAVRYLNHARAQGFSHTVHADQFTNGGSAVAVQTGASSADHLEASGDIEIAMLAGSNTVAVALPGASLGLGMGYAPARKLLDAGAALAIASDWNPGSAPMGDLLVQASILAAAEKLTTSETFAALTFRAAHALGFSDRGRIEVGQLADFQAYDCADYREILYYQGKLKPNYVWKNGDR